jgi:hypothetical protein
LSCANRSLDAICALHLPGAGSEPESDGIDGAKNGDFAMP